MIAKGLLWTVLARGVAKRFGWLPLLLIAGRMFKRNRPRAQRVEPRRR
jgi:hypothetical protein